MNPKNILIVAGEPSGDLHASNLVTNLKALKSDLRFFGMGGALLKRTGVEIVFDISDLALVGAVEVVKNIFTVKKAYDSIIRKINSARPDLAILVDYPGFNLRLAKKLKKMSIPVAYYISPQVWAWGMDRIDIISECVKQMIVFFKFEEELYKAAGINAEFVGHPLVDVVKVTSKREDVLKKYGLSPQKTTIALLAGSRTLEVKSFLKIMISACEIIKDDLKDVQFIVSKHPSIQPILYEEAIKNSNSDIKVVEGDTYNIVGASSFAIVASGTATIETAIIGTPFLVVYKASLITFLLYRLVRTIPFVGLVNVIAKKEVVPELIQYDFTPQNTASKTIAILTDESKISSMRDELAKVKSSLGAPGACLRAAQSIIQLL
ncbi:MAG: lipid-A-disaccharide synthase [Candidatus Omnitrophica bacterium]|nr:lipid-A-disaccharide synthase [Candidatus Omnitrophota bacterium]